MLERFKIVVRDRNGKVIQIHEQDGTRGTINKVRDELNYLVDDEPKREHSITITRLV